jgi:abhydrolase domain-containing protein 13
MASMLSWLRIPFLASSGIAALGSGLLYFKQNELIYPRSFPAGSRTDVPTPSQFGISNAESIDLPTTDGETLHAYILRPSNTSLSKNITILLFHGNAGNIGHRLPIAKVLASSLGCNVLMLEYRGYGKSTGTPDEDGLTIDAQTALDYVRQRSDLKDSKLVIYGQSLGGAVAIKLVAENQHDGDIAGVILENTFVSIRKLIPIAFPPAKYLARLCHQFWASEETLPKITAKIPMLFLSGLKDEIVPAAMMRTLFEICSVETKIWRTFENGSHNATVAEPGYFDAIWEFLVQEVQDRTRGEKDMNMSNADVDPQELWS